MLGHLKAIWTFRHFWMSLVKMDLMTRYRKSVLGIGWSLLQPLAMTAILTVVFSQFVRDPDPTKDWRVYSVLTITAMTVYGFLRDNAQQGCQCLARNEAYIRQCPLPFSIYSLRTVLGNAVHYAITLAVILLIGMVLGGSWERAQGMLQASWMLLPMFFVSLVCAWALATIFGFATVYFNDVSHILEIAAQMFFFLTPIIYGRKMLDDNGRSWLVDWNPAAAFIEAYQKPLVDLEPASTQAYLLSCGFTAAMVLLAVLAIRLLSKRVIFQM